MWVNASIRAFQARLEVVRLEHMAGRGQDNIEATIARLDSTLDEFTEAMTFRPFTEKRKPVSNG